MILSLAPLDMVTWQDRRRIEVSAGYRMRFEIPLLSGGLAGQPCMRSLLPCESYLGMDRTYFLYMVPM